MRLLYYYGDLELFNGNKLEKVELNFSREYEFEFDKDSNSLKIRRSDKFIPSNFWSRKGMVYNCSVFVGQNGTGKTAILHKLMEEVSDVYGGNKGDRLFVLQHNLQIIGIRSLSGKRLRSVIESSELEKEKRFDWKSEELNDLWYEFNKLVYFSPAFSENDYILIEKTKKRENNKNQDCIKHLSTVGQMKNLIPTAINGQGWEDPLLVFWVNRYIVEVGFLLSDRAYSIRTALNEATDFRVPMPDQLSISNDLMQSDIILKPDYCREINDWIGKVSGSEGKKRDVVFSIALFSVFNNGQLLIRGIDKIDELIKKIKDKYPHAVTSRENQKKIINELIIFLGEIASEIKSEIEKTNAQKYISNVKMFVEYLYRSETVFIDKFNISEAYRRRYDTAIHKDRWKLTCKVSELLNYQIEVSEFLNLYKKTLIESTRPYLSISWGLSSGEENVLYMISALYEIAKEYLENGEKDKTIQIYIDEADIGYHPEWQRQWFYVFSFMLEELFKDTQVEDIQLFLATHSPLLLGDVPERCSYFLRKNDGGVVELSNAITDARGNRVGTFGENLYQILQSGFFLQKGALGEIAIKKSEEIVEGFQLLRRLIMIKEKGAAKGSEEEVQLIRQINEKNENAKKILDETNY